MSFRFNSFNIRASKLLPLVPSIIGDPDYNKLGIGNLIEQYSEDLPNPDIINLALQLWKRKWLNVPVENRPSSLAKAIKVCDKQKFANVLLLIKIGCTLPVTSTACESSFSAMRILRTWLRCSIKSYRFGTLAITNIQRSVEVNYEEAPKLFFTLYPMKIYESSLIFS